MIPLPAIALFLSRPSLGSGGRARSVERLLVWRARNPSLFQSLRIAGMKRSLRVRNNMQRLHREFKGQWRESAMGNPKLQAGEAHIAAKRWKLLDPSGRIHEFRNLKQFVRDHAALFYAEDVEWKSQAGTTGQWWCRAFQCLARLRPTCAKPLGEWQGWRWAA